MLCPSTPDAPLLARTFVQAAASVLGANTLSIKLNHLPPLTPLPSADSMRSVQIDASTHVKSRSASPPCVASSALPAFCCLDPFIAHPPSCPPSLARGYVAPSSRGPSLPDADRSGTVRALLLPGSHTPRRSLRFLCLAVRTSRPQPRYGPSVVFPVASTRPAGLTTQASPWMSRLAAPCRRNGFVILRAVRSPPAAPHPVSRRRSCLRLHVPRLHIGWTFTLLTRQHHGRTHPGKSRGPDRRHSPLQWGRAFTRMVAGPPPARG